MSDDIAAAVLTVVVLAALVVAAGKTACHLDAQRVESGHRVCFYDCGGRPYVVRIGLNKECSATLDR